MYKALCRERKFEIEKCKVRIFLADGTSQCARIRIRLPIVIRNNTYMHVCHVVPRLNRESWCRFGAGEDHEKEEKKEK